MQCLDLELISRFAWHDKKKCIFFKMHEDVRFIAV